MQTAQASSGFAYVKSTDVTPSHPEPGLTRRVGVSNEKLTVVEHRMEKGWIGARHGHPHDQVVYVISGHLKVTCGAISFEVKAGDSFVVKGGLEHQASAVEASHVIDVFTPRRDDYL
jgi:quercetin dioxygenase-like cupin family protein